MYADRWWKVCGLGFGGAAVLAACSALTNVEEDGAQVTASAAGPAQGGATMVASSLGSGGADFSGVAGGAGMGVGGAAGAAGRCRHTFPVAERCLREPLQVRKLGECLYAVSVPLELAELADPWEVVPPESLTVGYLSDTGVLVFPMGYGSSDDGSCGLPAGDDAAAWFLAPSLPVDSGEFGLGLCPCICAEIGARELVVTWGEEGCGGGGFLGG